MYINVTVQRENDENNDTLIINFTIPDQANYAHVREY